MKTPHVFTASAAAVLAMAIAAFAQEPQSSRPATEAQTAKQTATAVTVVGCVQREADYRKANDAGRGGVAATGVGQGNEYVLVNASKVSAGAAAPAGKADCASTAAGEAYELTGNRERELEKFVGRHVEISGMLKEAKTTTGPDGTAKPTGGFDPLRGDLKLFEVEVQSFREPSADQSAAAPAAAAPPAPAPPAAAPPAAPQPPSATPAQPASQPSPSTAPRRELPRTASPMPLVGLLGALSLALGLGLRRRS